MSEEQKQAVDSNDIEGLEEQKLTDEQSGESKRVVELEAELEEAKNQVLRAAAEVQNMRRRAEQDIEKAHKFALEKFAVDLLPVLDSLERGIEVSVGDHESVAAIREGMELTLKVFKDTLKRFNIEEVNPEGEPFNPDTQQAMAMEPNVNVEPNTVLKVFQKGYLINGRLLRPAMVVVSKAP